MRPWAVAVLVLALAAPLAAGTGHAQAPPADGDEDGVVDQLDECPDSPAYELVDPAGCSVCDCLEDATGEPWSSRAAYIRCVLDEIRVRRGSGQLDRKAARLVIKAARSSSCGYATKVRCCIVFPEKPIGLCRVMDELRCHAELMNDVPVENRGIGSCFPNPCSN